VRANLTCTIIIQRHFKNFIKNLEVLEEIFRGAGRSSPPRKQELRPHF